MSLITIADDIWGVEASLALPGVILPLRSTVLRLNGGAIIVHSPVAFTDQQAQAIDALGTVKAIVAPSGLHHLHASAAKTRWPTAQLWAPRSLRDKQIGASVAHWLDEPWPFGEEVEVHGLAGAPKASEYVFYQRASCSLVVVDLVFNIVEPKGWLSRMVYGLFGTYRHFDSSRLYRRYIEDRAAFAASLEAILALPFRRIVMAHGEVLEGEGLPERLRHVTRRLCQ